MFVPEDNPADAEPVLFEVEDAGLVFTPKVVATVKDSLRAVPAT